MNPLLKTTYRVLLKNAARIDKDVASRALVTSTPTQAYDHMMNDWVNIDVTKSWQESKKVANKIISDLNEGREWYLPPNPGDESTGKGTLSEALKKAFRNDAATNENLNIAFSAVKLLSQVDEYVAMIPKEPPFPPMNRGFKVHPGLEPMYRRGDPTATDSVFLLAAHPVMSGFFRHAIVLMVEAGETGALGMVINKPLTNEQGHAVPVWAVVPEAFHKIFSKHLGNNPVMIGGPVRSPTADSSEYGIMMLHRVADIPDSIPLGGGMFMGGSLDAVAEAIESGKASPSDCMVVMGYSGWGRGQIDGEIARGSWMTAETSDAMLALEMNTVQVPASGDEDSQAVEEEDHQKRQKELWCGIVGGFGESYQAMTRLADVREMRFDE